MESPRGSNEIQGKLQQAKVNRALWRGLPLSCILQGTRVSPYPLTAVVSHWMQKRFRTD